MSDPATIMIGKLAPNIDVTHLVDFETLYIEETGIHESATAGFSWTDKTNAYSSLRGKWRLATYHGGSPTFWGFIDQPTSEIEAIYGHRDVTAFDAGRQLDRLIIDAPGVKRSATDDATDKARIQWLWANFAGGTDLGGMTDWTKVQALTTAPDAQAFPTRLTLRQALERILSLDNATGANYFLDANPRLWTFDDSNPVSFAAPYDVNVTASPSGTEIAPGDLHVDWDASGLVNYYYGRGKGIHGPYSDADSVAAYGVWKDYFDAPDADTTTKLQRAVRAALRDTREPIPRITFTVEGASCVRAGVRWQAGQLVYITSPTDGLDKATDSVVGGGGRPSAWQALQPFRIVHLTTHYLSGKGDRRMEIEVNGRRRHLYGG